MCGIAGLVCSSDDNEQLLPILYECLYFLKRRGQESAGVALISPSAEEKIRVIKRKGEDAFVEGEISRSFREEIEKAFNGKVRMALVQTRYATSGKSLDEMVADSNAQPMHITYDFGEGVAVHNGNIPDMDNLKGLVDKLSGSAATNDTRFLTELYVQELFRGDSFSASRFLMENVKGSYSFMFSDGNNLHILRDRWGFRPLCVGKVDDTLIFNSESGLFNILDAKMNMVNIGKRSYMKEISPGEAMIVSPEGTIRSKQVAEPMQRFCFFETIYFSSRNSRSVNPEISNQEVRQQLGIEAFNYYKDVFSSADLVVPVMDSGISYAQGLGFATSIRVSDALYKIEQKRYFIEPRDKRNHKFAVNDLQVRGRNLVITDDSIVRADTIVKACSSLKLADAKSISFVSICPPYVKPCLYGIDTPVEEERELIANQLLQEGIIRYGERGLEYNVEEVNRAITIKVRDKIKEEYPHLDVSDINVYYLPMDVLKQTLPQAGYCFRCIDDVNPLD